MPASAESCEPNPGWSARGPVWPILQVDSITSRGLSADSADKPRPSRSITPGRMFSMIRSHHCAMRRASATPARLLQVDGDAVFRIVEEGEAAAAVVARTIVPERRILDAEAVGTVTRFHVNDAGPEIGHQLADMRAGGIAAEFEHLDTRQRLRDRGHGTGPLPFAAQPLPPARGTARRPRAAAAVARRR